MTSNTGKEQVNRPGTFKKGDARINRNGRPKSFDTLRKLAQQIAHEEAKNKDGRIVIDGHIVTMTEAILRQWAMSKDPRTQQKFMEVAYGKVPERIEHTGKDGAPVGVAFIDYRSDIEGNDE